MKHTPQDLKAQYQLQMDEEGILLARCAHLSHEVFWAVFLDNQHHIISIEHLFTDTLDGCEVHSRVIAKRVLKLNAVAVIVFHNHPSGNPEPSETDRNVTELLKQALALLDIRVLDHLVIGGRQHVSLASRGWV
ncbi:JAB domain-containing protein [Xanthomonas oryzae]|uniref:JAB domain-containing protein n=1 Tax=Xanthomonas oryzae TaxID=347 RepID=UPI002DEDBACE|nr:JAB domain-containing protein [Xanthomonas oryzae pv. oryzicola]MEC5114043.1 JAB domain-containing protein [Xanthomonas oryzae pv. oryzicola]